jgi:hypothetical protein
MTEIAHVALLPDIKASFSNMAVESAIMLQPLPTGYAAEMGAGFGLTEWQPLEPIAEPPEGEPVRCRGGRVDVVVVRRGAQVTVLADRCLHLSGPRPTRAAAPAPHATRDCPHRSVQSRR